MIEMVLLLSVALAMGWLLSEFQSRVWLRLTLGVSALLMAFGFALASGFLVKINENAWHAARNKDLIENTIIELEADRTDVVLEGLRELRSQYHPNYENRGDYEQHIERYVNWISEDPIRHKPGSPGWHGQ